MSTFSVAPRLVKGGIVSVDVVTGAIRRIIGMQFNPDSVTRTLQVQGVGSDGGDRAQALRLKGPPVESIKLEAEIDATDQLEFPDRNPVTIETGIHPQLAALETLVYPSSVQILQNNALAQVGTLEIVPMQAPMTLFVWSKVRIVPVRISEFSVTEEAFDSNLNPIRAKVSLGMRVLNENDLGFSHRGTSLYLAYQQQKERFADQSKGAGLNQLGIGGI